MNEAYDFRNLLRPVPDAAVFAEAGWYVWCGSMVRDEEGLCHLYYSRWRLEHGFSAWVSHSEVAHAVADDPLGPYQFVDVALPQRGAQFWDGHCTHNPTVHRFGKHYYLYYTGNRGRREGGVGLAWSHRNAQRIGVAVADSPAGPWHRRDAPLIEPAPEFHDALCCANPTVLRRLEGDYLLIYKAVGDRHPLPFGGPVVHVAATAAAPDGPFTKHPAALFTAGAAAFPAEDPFIWRERGRYWALVKDMAGFFTGAGVSLALMSSPDGFRWSPAAPALAARTEYRRADGSVRRLDALERPQVWLENDAPAVLFCAGAEKAIGERSESFNVAIPLGLSPK